MAAGAVAAPTLLRGSVAAAPMGAPGTAGPVPYGPLGAANADGIQLPAGFTSRLIATSGANVTGTGLVWPSNPDGGACTPRTGGGWLYLANGEASGGLGGVAAVAFDPAGAIVDAYPILTGTTRSCSGSMTPWGTYLSGEENPTGRVFECNPQARSQGVHRPLLGSFHHEMIAVDPRTGAVYMVEDQPLGRLYRFVPTRPGDLSAGALFAAVVARGRVWWVPASTTAPDRSAATTAFNGGEGAWIMHDALYFTTKGDVRVWRLQLTTNELSVVFDAMALASAGTPLTAVDNLVGLEGSGELFVAEDGGNMEVCVVGTVGAPAATPFLRFVGHDASEVTGVAFSPDETRLYVSSQRGIDGVTGRTYEITGPFHRAAVRRRQPAPRRRWH